MDFARFIAKSIKEDTEVIRGAIPEIKHDTERILQEIQDFRTAYQTGNRNPTANVLFDSYLDGLTSYAGTVCEEVVWETDDDGQNGAENGGQPVHNMEQKHTNQDKEVTEELKEQVPSDLEHTKNKCHSCKSEKSNGGAFGFSCDHWMCAECVRTKFKDATQREDYPMCCKTSSLSPRRASHLLGDELKNKYDKVLGFHKLDVQKKAAVGMLNHLSRDIHGGGGQSFAQSATISFVHGVVTDGI